ncbi:hypothetical protein V2I01_41030 [Micromonospora sp. BRA006-A]|nr:hypothetical protein [Micromonospora sp. BRA006-A]
MILDGNLARVGPPRRPFAAVGTRRRPGTAPDDNPKIYADEGTS